MGLRRVTFLYNMFGYSSFLFPYSSPVLSYYTLLLCSSLPAAKQSEWHLDHTESELSWMVWETLLLHLMLVYSGWWAGTILRPWCGFSALKRTYNDNLNSGEHSRGEFICKNHQKCWLSHARLFIEVSKGNKIWAMFSKLWYKCLRILLF